MGAGRMNDCVNCKYANQSKNTRVIRTPAAVITQKQGGIVCENTGQKTIQITDIHTSTFTILGYAVLLGLMMLKSGTLAKSVLNAH